MGCLKLSYYERETAIGEKSKIFELGIEKSASGSKICKDYYAYGSVMPNANNLGAGTYRYGMNGMERDNEIKGAGNSYTSYFRQYDPRLGRWMSDEPKPVAWESGYAAFRNNPITNVDPKGDFPKLGIGKWLKNNIGRGGKAYRKAKKFQKANGGQIMHSKKHGFYSVDKGVAGGVESKVFKYGNMPASKALLFAGSTIASNQLYQGRGSVDVSQLTEEQKQQEFKNSSDNTNSIMLMEFVTGTAPEEGRKFDESHKVTQDLKWSLSSRQAVEKLEQDITSGVVMEGEWTVPYDIASSPDRTNLGNSVLHHMEHMFTGKTTPILRGGMRYSFRVVGKTIEVKVTDAYTVSSGIRSSPSNNPHGENTPGVEVKVEYNFKYDFPGLKK